MSFSRRMKLNMTNAMCGTELLVNPFRVHGYPEPGTQGVALGWNSRTPSAFCEHIRVLGHPRSLLLQTYGSMCGGEAAFLFVAAEAD